MFLTVGAPRRVSVRWPERGLRLCSRLGSHRQRRAIGTHRSGRATQRASAAVGLARSAARGRWRRRCVGLPSVHPGRPLRPVAARRRNPRWQRLRRVRSLARASRRLRRLRIRGLRPRAPARPPVCTIAPSNRSAGAGLFRRRAGLTCGRMPIAERPAATPAPRLMRGGRARRAAAVARCVARPGAILWSAAGATPEGHLPSTAGKAPPRSDGAARMRTRRARLGNGPTTWRPSPRSRRAPPRRRPRYPRSCA